MRSRRVDRATAADSDDDPAGRLKSMAKNPLPQHAGSHVVDPSVVLVPGNSVTPSPIVVGRLSDADISMLQTAAALENLMTMLYKAVLLLPFIGGDQANPFIRAFATKTQAQHVDHAQAFNSVLVSAGAKVQEGPNPKYAPFVVRSAPASRSAMDVVSLAVVLEDVAAQTYVKDAPAASTAALRQMFASVAGVEAQHKAMLLIMKTYMSGDGADRVASPPDMANLPPAFASVAFPDARFPVDKASPLDEGAVR